MSQLVDGDRRPTVFPVWHVDFGYTPSQVTTNAYVIYGAAHGWVGKDKATIMLTETGGANGALYQVQASLDGTNWVTLKTDVALAASAVVYETITDLWTQLRINIIDAIPASHATVAIEVMYKTLM
jgi:hypothetical protein